MSEQLTAILQLDISAFQAALTAASQQVSAFAQSLSAGIAGSSAAFQQQVQQINQVADATRKAAQTTRDAAKDSIAAIDEIGKTVQLMEKEWAAGQREWAILERERAAIAKAVAKERVETEQAQMQALTNIQKDFFNTSVGLAKERQAQETATTQAIEALQRNFFNTTTGLAQEAAAAQAAQIQEVAAIQRAFFVNAIGMAKERQAQETATASATAQLQKDFFATTVGLAKEASAVQAAQIKEVEALQKAFFANTMGMANAHLAEEKRIADERTAQYRATEEAQKKAVASAAAAQKEAAQNNLAQEKATSDALMRLISERTEAESAQIAQQKADWQKLHDFRRELAIAAAAFQKRLADEEVFIARVAAEKKREILEQADLKFRARMAIDNSTANASIAQTLGQAPGLLQLGASLGGSTAQTQQVAQQVFMLQGYINLLQQATSQSTIFSAAIARIGNSFRILGGYLVAATLIQFLYELGRFPGVALAVSMKMEDLRLSFVAIEGSSQKAANTMDFLFRTAQKAGTEFTTVADAFKRMDAAAKGTSLEGEGMRKVFEGIILGARALGVSSDGVSHALVAVEQIMTKGRLTAEEYRRQLGNAIPGALQKMAEGFGVTTQVLERMIASGLIPADAAVVALGSSLGKLGSGNMAENLDRLSSSFAKLKNEGTAWMSAIGDWIGDKLKPFLDITLKISAALREMLSIGPPGTGAKFTPAGPSPYDADIAKYATQFGLNQQMFRNLIQAESGFNPYAQGPRITSGPAEGYRAMGLGQILWPTAKQYGVESYGQLMDPQVNLRVSANYLSDLIKMLTSHFGDLDDKVKLATAAYNAGIGNVEEGLRKLQAAGKALTFENLAPLLPQPGQTTPYVNSIFSTIAASAASAGGGDLNPLDFLAKSIPKTLDAIKNIEKEMDNLAKSPLNFGGLLGDALTKQADEAVKDYAKIAELLARFPEFASKLTDEQQKQLVLAGKQVASLQQRLLDEAQTPANAARRIAEFRKTIEAEELQAQERKTLEEKANVDIEEMTQGQTASKLKALEQRLAKMREVNADENVIERLGAAERARIYAEEYQAFLKTEDGKFAKIKARSEEQMRLEHLAAGEEVRATKSRLDDADEELQKRREQIEEGVRLGVVGIETLNKLEAAGAANRRRIVTEEQDKLAKEAAKPWRELAQTIEGTLSSAFESVLSGSKSLFEGIRDAFLKLLAKLAADALANAIIIPVLMNFVGGGGIGGLGGAISSSGLGNLGFAGAGGTTGGVDASGGAGGALGTAVGFASSANSISGALGGPSIGIGTFLGSTALGSTELGELGLSGAGYVGFGSEGLIGPLGPATTTLAGAAGTVIGGVGAGVAVGMILSKINSLIGFHGTGSAVAAGAGGGAAAGALIGSAFPIIGTGIGAGVGAAIGALGGFISTLFGKNAKQPGFQIESLQPGQIEYDTSIGLRVKQDFKILDDFHQKLGVDYEDFTKTIEDGFNTLFENTVSQISGASPEVQRALVEPLNAAFQDVAAQIEAYPKIGGDDFKKQLEKMMGEDIPKIFTDAANGAIGKLVDAVKKIDPVVQAFNKIIDAIMQDIDTLRQQQLALDTSLAANIKTLRESLYTPQQLLAARAQELGSLMNRFDTGSEGDKIILAPAIGQLAVEVMGLAKSVEDLKIQEIGRTISQATTQRQTDVVTQGIKTLSEALFTPRQTLGARQTDLSDLMDQFRAGDTTIRLLLAPQITQLALQIMDLAKGVDDLAASQALLAEFPAQLRTLKEALYSPAQTFLSLQSQFDELMAQFRAGSPDQRTTLEPQIAQLASQILELAKGQDVLGQDPQLLRQTQTALLAAVQEMQNVITAQATAGTNNQANIQAVLEATNAALINTLQEVQVGVASSVADSGREVIQAVYATAGQIILTSWNTSNGVINAEYASANGMISAQYTTSGGLVNAQYTTAGGVINAQYATANNMVSAQYINANGVVTAAYNSAAGVAGSVYYSTGALAGAIYDTQGQVIGVQYAVGNQISNTVAAYGAWNANGVAGSNYLLNWMGNNIWYTQNALISQVASVRDTAWVSYQNLVNTLYVEIGKAQEQINLLVGALYHLETLDDVLRNALGVLGAMNARLGNPLQVNMGESLMTQLQRESTWWQQQQYHLTQNANVGVIALLNRISGATDWEGSMALGRLFASGQAGGFQHGGYVPRNMFSVLHAGEQVIPEWSNRGNNRGSSPINIHVYGGNKDVTQIADAVMDRIEQKSGRLQSSRIQTRGR